MNMNLQVNESTPTLPTKLIRREDSFICPNTTTWSKWSAELALKDTWFKPSYCCSIVANLLHTCNPPKAGTLTYSVLVIYIYALTDGVCVRGCMRVCVCVRACTV